MAGVVATMEWAKGNGVGGEPASVFIVCGHAPERRALQEMFEDEGLRVLGSTGSVPEALAGISALHPDVALVDTLLRDEPWIAVCRRIWDESPSVRCLVLGSRGDEAELRATVLAGAKGHAVRMVRGGDLLRRVRSVAAGEDLVDPAVREAVLAEFGPWAPGPSVLDPIEQHVLLLCAKGLSDTGIRQELGLGEPGFDAVLHSALAKLGYAAAGTGARGDKGEAEPSVLGRAPA